LGQPLHTKATKAAFSLGTRQVQRSKLELRRLYTLPSPSERDNAREIEILPLSQSAMVQALVGSSFNIEVFDRERLARQFTFATTVASRVEGFALRYPAGLHHLLRVRRAVLDHIRERTIEAVRDRVRDLKRIKGI
jgi:hypothetical protein